MKTDTELQHDVQEELRWDPHFDAAEIGVTVEDGVFLGPRVTTTNDLRPRAIFPKSAQR